MRNKIYMVNIWFYVKRNVNRAERREDVFLKARILPLCISSLRKKAGEKSIRVAGPATLLVEEKDASGML